MTDKRTFKELLSCASPILSDGAMGTTLHARGISGEACFDALNLKQPSLVADVHRDYIEAGSQMIQTNTFGANRFKLAQYGLADKVAEINSAGVELARRVILASFKDVLIAGDMGPLGVRLAPFGRVQPEQAFAAFQEQAAALNAAQVDLIVLETFTDLYEIVAAIQAVKSVNPDLPVLASMTFTRDNRTLLGDSPAKVARRIHETGADVVGINCSGGPNQLLNLLRAMREAVPDAAFSVMPNAGWPQQVEGQDMHPAGGLDPKLHALVQRLAGVGRLLLPDDATLDLARHVGRPAVEVALQVIEELPPAGGPPVPCAGRPVRHPVDRQKIPFRKQFRQHG